MLLPPRCPPFAASREGPGRGRAAGGAWVCAAADAERGGGAELHGPGGCSSSGGSDSSRLQGAAPPCHRLCVRALPALRVIRAPALPAHHVSASSACAERCPSPAPASRSRCPALPPARLLRTQRPNGWLSTLPTARPRTLGRQASGAGCRPHAPFAGVGARGGDEAAPALLVGAARWQADKPSVPPIPSPPYPPPTRPLGPAAPLHHALPRRCGRVSDGHQHPARRRAAGG